MVKSICVLGDSLAKGVILDKIKERYVHLKDCFANIFSEKTGIYVKNYAKFGCTISKGLEIFDRVRGEVKDYDYVALEFGGNDCNFKWDEISLQPDLEHLPATPMDQFLTEYQALVHEVKQAGGNPVIMNLPPLDAPRFFKWVSKGNQPEHILKWLGEVDVIYRWHESYSNAACKIAEEMEVPLIDIRSAFLTGDYAKYMCEDGMHINPDGHRLIVQTLQDYVRLVA